MFATVQNRHDLIHARVFRRGTDQEIEQVIWADDVLGICEQFKTDPVDGRLYLDDHGAVARHLLRLPIEIRFV